MRFFLQCLVAFMAFNLTSPALADAGLPSTISAEIKGTCERTYKLLGPGRVLKCIRQKSEEYIEEAGLQPSSPTQENGLAEDNANGNASNQRQLGQERVYGGKTEKN